jgi:hypothetical protein
VWHETVKYRPDYPELFDEIGARRWRMAFFRWYNAAHYQTGLR